MIKSLYDNKLADLVLGLFDPSKFGLPNWLGYKIQDPDGEGLRNYGRFLYVIANRNGEMGGVCPLFFDGAVCDFEELPLPSDANVGKYYYKASQLKSMKHQKTLQKLKSMTLTVLSKLKVNGRAKNIIVGRNAR